MNCKEAAEKIPLVVAGELRSGDVDAHVASCAACAELAKEMTGIDALCRETFRSLRPARAVELPRRRQLAAVLTAAAAILLVALVLGYYLTRSEEKPGPVVGPQPKVEPRPEPKAPEIVENLPPKPEPKPAPRPAPEPEPKPEPKPEPAPEPKPEPEPEPEPAPVPAKGTAGIAGAVLFRGDPPANLKIQMSSDAYCAGSHKDDAFAEGVLVKDGRLQNVLVYVKTGLKGKFDPPAEAVILEQDGCVYRPHVVAVMVGQKLVVRNNDDTSHNIHFLPKVNPEDNFSQARKDMTAERVFKTPEIGAKIKCDVHPWMAAYLHVLRHPYYSLTLEDGSFHIPDLPPGRYTLAAWHEKFGEKTAVLDVEADKQVRVDFKFEN